MTSDDAPAPAVRESFAPLTHEIRLEILLALLEDWHAVYTEPKSYAELMDAVGIRDSGKFNYHLDRLRGVYVREVEGGYVPTAAVTALYRTVLAHRPTEQFAFGPEPLDATCPRCDAAPVLRYERGFASVDCPACDDWTGFTYPFPKHGIETRDGDADAVFRAVTRRARHHAGMARAGQCPYCAGTTTVDPRLEAVGDDDYWVEIACDTCTFVVGVEPLSTLLFEEHVSNALADAGVDREGYEWNLTSGTTRLDSRDPVRIALAVEGDAGTATVVLDENLAVRSVAVDHTDCR